MTAMNHSLIMSLIGSIDDFVSGKLDVEAMREQLRTRLTLLERGPVDFHSVIRSAEATLDLNQYTISEEDQRGAAIAEMTVLRKFLLNNLSLE